jgi:hypothetical protein
MNQDASNGGSLLLRSSSTGIDALVPGSDGQNEAINSALQKAN